MHDLRYNILFSLTPWNTDGVSPWRIAASVALIVLGQLIEWMEQFTPSWIDIEAVILWMFPMLWVL